MHLRKTYFLTETVLAQSIASCVSSLPMWRFPLSQPNPFHSDDDRAGTLRASVMLFAFGLLVLGYLVAIGHPDWFVLRPVSSASSALYEAAQHGNDA